MLRAMDQETFRANFEVDDDLPPQQLRSMLGQKWREAASEAGFRVDLTSVPTISVLADDRRRWTVEGPVMPGGD